MRYLVSHFSKLGGSVLDLCCGTGSTTIAALSLCRNSFAVDTNKEMLEAVAMMINKLKVEFEEKDTEQPKEKAKSKQMKKLKRKQVAKQKARAPKPAPFVRSEHLFFSLIYICLEISKLET